MSDKREINEEYALIAADLINNSPYLEYIKVSKATIIYLSSRQKKTSKGKTVCAQCERVPEKYRWGIPCDFTITVFEPNVERMTPEQIKILLYHELLHVGIELDSNSGNETYSIRPHDLEDFKLIITLFGTEWAKIKDDAEEMPDISDYPFPEVFDYDDEEEENDDEEEENDE